MTILEVIPKQNQHSTVKFNSKISNFMKNCIVIFIILLNSLVVYSQGTYKKVYKYGEYNDNWAMVKTISGTYGFINREGQEVVPSIYAKIYKFGGCGVDFVLLKTISGMYGLINKEGKEVVPTIYARIEKFDTVISGVAIVKSISGNYGAINREGKEIIPTVYKRDEVVQRAKAL